ncbi:ABC transporter permease [Vibrio sinaloensis]|uniref:ABC transporter permease n=1 Tax=Photobacterium sp. (strain ATCC 43367) TaxID=379097 RepID=UPI0035EC22C3
MFRAAYLFLIIIAITPTIPGLVGVVLSSFSYIPPIGLNRFSLSGYQHLVEWPGLLSSALLTISSSILSTYVALLLCFIVLQAFWQSRYWRKIENALSPLLAIPHVAFAIGFSFLFAPTGLFTRSFTYLTGIELNDFSTSWLVHDPFAAGLTIALSIKELPFLLLMSIPILQQLNLQATIKVSSSLGYSPYQTWWKVIFPQWLAKMRFPIFAVIAYGASVVDFALVLGPNTPPTLAMLVWQWFSDPDLSLLPRAASGAVLLFVIAALLLAFVVLMERLLLSYFSQWQYSGRFGFRVPGSPIVILVITINLILLPLMLIWSFAQRWRFPELFPSQISGRFWLNEWDSVLPTVTDSIIIAVITACFALLLSLTAHEYRIKHKLHLPSYVIALPMLVPQLSILFGMQITTLYLASDHYYLWVIWSHVFFAFPFVYLALDGPWRSYNQGYSNAALSLGKTPFYVFITIKAKILLKPIWFAWAVGASVSLAQYLPTLMLGGGRVATITTEAVALSSGFDRRVTAIYGLLQAVLPFLFFTAAITLGRLAQTRPITSKNQHKESVTHDASSRKPRHP